MTVLATARSAMAVLAIGMSGIVAACGGDAQGPAEEAFVQHGLETNVLVRSAPAKVEWTGHYRCLFERTRGDVEFQNAFMAMGRGEDLPGEFELTFNREIAACIAPRG